jgi:nucleotide-binding universal stress UspA family protein
MPTIVCAVDDSDRSPAVAEAGAWLARELAAPLVLARVFDAMAISAPTTKELRLAGVAPEHIANVERQRVREALGDTAELLTGVDPTIEFVEGQVVPELLRLAREHHARLLLTGRAVRTPLERMMNGSASSDLASDAPCPVVVVTENAALDEPGPVLAGYDGSGHSLRAVQHGAILAEGLQRELVLVHVAPSGASSPTEDDIAAKLQAAARDCRRGCSRDIAVVIEHGDPVAQITRAARDRAAAAVVVGTRGSGAVGEMLLGSVSAGVVCGAGRPVMLAGRRS